MTVLVTNFVAPAHYSQIANTIMDYEYVNAEQVGFIVAPKSKKSLLRLEMSGGEFCGNALLGAAAYCHYKGLTPGNKVTEIAGASEEQAAQSAEVLTFIESISAAAEEASASSEETAATANALTELAEELNVSVAAFKKLNIKRKSKSWEK